MNKFDALISEVDSTMWPIPGQDMHNRAVMHKSLPSLQSIINATPDTDPTNIINHTVNLAVPLNNIVNDCTNIYTALNTLKQRFIEAKSSPVYSGRARAQKTIDHSIKSIEKVEKYLYQQIIEGIDNLSLASLNEKQ